MTTESTGSRPTGGKISTGTTPDTAEATDEDRDATASKLVEREQTEGIAHEDRHTSGGRSRFSQPTEEDGERSQAQVGFRLAAAGREEQEVDQFTIGVSRFGQPPQVHEYERKLEWTPLRRIDLLRLDGLLHRPPVPGCRGHDAVRQAKRFKRNRLIK